MKAVPLCPEQRVRQAVRLRFGPGGGRDATPGAAVAEAPERGGGHLPGVGCAHHRPVRAQRHRAAASGGTLVRRAQPPWRTPGSEPAPLPVGTPPAGWSTRRLHRPAEVRCLIFSLSGRQALSWGGRGVGAPAQAGRRSRFGQMISTLAAGAQANPPPPRSQASSRRVRRHQGAPERDREDAESSQESVSYSGERQNGGGSAGAQARCYRRTMPALARCADVSCMQPACSCSSSSRETHSAIATPAAGCPLLWAWHTVLVDAAGGSPLLPTGGGSPSACRQRADMLRVPRTRARPRSVGLVCRARSSAWRRQAWTGRTRAPPTRPTATPPATTRATSAAVAAATTRHACLPAHRRQCRADRRFCLSWSLVVQAVTPQMCGVSPLNAGQASQVACMVKPALSVTCQRQEERLKVRCSTRP